MTQNLAPILIVEDDALIAMDLEDELRDHGFDTLWASTVEKAMALLQENPSFALLDMHLKSETTFELADHLNRIDLPFLFLSGNDVKSLPEHLKSSRLLTKPVMIEKVVAIVHALEPQT